MTWSSRYEAAVLNEDRAAIDLLDWKLIDRGDDIGAVVHQRRIVLVANFHVAGGHQPSSPSKYVFLFWSI